MTAQPIKGKSDLSAQDQGAITKPSFTRKKPKWNQAADAALAVALLRVLDENLVRPTDNQDTIMDTFAELGFEFTWGATR